MPSVRVLVAVTFLTLALAGCTAPEEEPSPLFGVCPQWLDGDGSDADLDAPGSVTLSANATMPHVGGNLSLDRYHLVLSEIATDGVIELRAFNEDDAPLRFTDVRSPQGPRTPTFLALDVDSGTVAVDVYLTDITHGAEADPGDLRLEATGVDGATGSLHVDVTPGYRVCGAVF